VTIDVFDISGGAGFDFSKTEIIEVAHLKLNEPRHLFLKLSKYENQIYSSCSFGLKLKYQVQEIDVKGNAHGASYPDEYKIDKKVEIKYSDYFVANPRVNLSNFEDFWKKCENSNFVSVEEKLQLEYNNIKAAGKGFSQLIGFEPLNELEKIDPTARKYEFLFAAISYIESLVI
jgi:uncharacterized protein YdgA (DUF945 family)